MILNSIFLHLDGRFFPREMCTQLKHQSRHITYFIQRKIREEKYFSEKFNRVVIEPSVNPSYAVFINSEAVASISVKFDVKRFLESSKSELNKYYVELIEDGLEKFNKQHSIPLRSMFDAIKILSENKFVDHWVYKEKINKKYKIFAKLSCKMNIDEFNLDLEVSKEDQLIFNGLILTTPPNEILFHNEFKDIVINERSVSITKRIPSAQILVDVPF